MLPLLYIAGVTSPPVTLALTVMTSSPPSTPNDGYQVVSLSWPKGDHRGDRLTRSITRSGTHVGVERHQTGENLVYGSVSRGYTRGWVHVPVHFGQWGGGFDHVFGESQQDLGSGL